MTDTHTADAHSAFEELRGRLFGIAYRMTGSVTDAEDALQDAWLKWRSVDPTTVRNPEAFLVSLVTRLSIDRLRSAQLRRETYVGPYLPEPIIEGATGVPPVATDLAHPQPADPERAAELSDSLTFAFLVLMDELGPEDRAVFLLHDVFGYSFDEVAEAVGSTTDAVRQRASRARRRLDEDRVELRRASDEDEQRVLGALMVAMAEGDIPGLMELLSPDVVQLDDAGPNRRAGRRPIVGPHRVARLMVNLAKRLPAEQTFEVVRVNGSPGVLLSLDGKPDIVLSFDLAPDGRVRRIWSQLNPDKLTHLG